MLKKAQRLSRTDFATYFKGGKRLHTDCATLVFHPHPSFHGAVVVSKKVSKLAVTRNTIRRRVYAQLYKLPPGSKNGVFVVLIKPTYSQLTKQSARTQIQLLIERAAKPA
jgi:ribonuclease P protein component